MLPLNHVVGIGYGKKYKRKRRTEEDSIVILVDKKLPIEHLEEKDMVPQALGHLKTDVQEIGSLELLNAPRSGRYRPAPGGVSIGHYKISAGTLGAIVKDKKSGSPLILSNNHVLANITNGNDGRSKIGDPILQPGSHDKGSQDNDVIGHLKRFVPLKSNTGIFGSSTNIVDCAVATPIDEDIIDSEIVGVGNINGIREAEVDMNIIKSGRTTGVTEGVVRTIDSTVTVNIDNNRQAVFTDQIVTSPISKGGDSGSLVLDRDRNAVGLLFAGSNKATVCNKISNVMNELNIEFFGVREEENKPGEKKEKGNKKDNKKRKPKIDDQKNEINSNYNILLLFILLIFAIHIIS